MTDVLTLAHCNCSVGLRTYDAFYIQECIHEINIHLRTDKKTEYRLSFQAGASAVGQGKTLKDPDMGTEQYAGICGSPGRTYAGGVPAPLLLFFPDPASRKRV